MFGLFGDHSALSLILALNLFLNIQEMLKFCLENRKKLTQTYFFCFKEKDQKTCPHILHKHLVKLRIYSKTSLTEQVVFSKKQKEKERKYFKYSGVFFSLYSTHS